MNRIAFDMLDSNRVPEFAIVQHLPNPGYHSFPRTYLVSAKFIHIPLFRADRCHTKVDGYKDSAAEQRPIYDPTSRGCQKRQEKVYGGLAGVMRAQQVREDGMGGKSITLVLGAQLIQIRVVGVLECVRREDRGDKDLGLTICQSAGGVLTLYPDGNVDCQVEDKPKQPVREPHLAFACRGEDDRLEHAAHALEKHQPPHHLQLRRSFPHAQPPSPEQRAGD
jgi:hypothetical protein